MFFTFFKLYKWYQIMHIIIIIFYRLLPNFLVTTGSFCTKSFARSENSFINTSDIMNGLNVPPIFASRQILAEGNLLSSRLNCFNVFQSFFRIFCYLLVFPQSMFFSLFELNFRLSFVLPCRFLHQHVILLT